MPALLPVLLLAVSPAEVAARIDEILAASPASARANWGIAAEAIESRETVVAKNPDRYFIPASNTKLYSTALALVRLGPHHRLDTILVRDPNGDLRLIGGGDPTMSWRKYPYEKGPNKGNPLAAIEEFADMAVRKGIRHVTGDIVGDDTKWPSMPYPDGWSIDDAIWEYGAPVSALTINDNAIQITVRPGTEIGAAARVSLNPALEYYAIDNRLRTETGERQFEIVRTAPGQLRLLGRIAPRSTGRSELVAIDDPALYAAHALADALTRRGVRIDGRVRAEHRAEGDPAPVGGASEIVAVRKSRPVEEIVAVVNKVSQNLHAELLLREVGFQASGEGTARAGIDELKKLLAEIGVDKNDYDFRDASGLSRLTLTTPATTVKLLAHMHSGPLRDVWLSSLPVGGVDGSLENRFKGMADGARVRAKTGALTHVTALGGYIDSESHGRLAFSIVANGFNAPASEIRATIDKICLELAK
ncbi:MAG: D-alanyl-D-alanine carboxypeptidase/D-alanyl-D-alanine-endopeptidase [Bryobacteraceae bacterium]|nr:D-alanyl-D-alanine carboxypeptidase/D-alanyl-D-alanine-endopeptidase [Bryobacteraceae bacterium]